MIDEKKLIKGCLAGKREFQRKLYDYYSGKMLGVCLRYTGDINDAEDVLQDGFIKVFTKLNDFKGKGSFEGWIRRIMVNTALESFRKKNHLYPVSDYDGLESELLDDRMVDEMNAEELMKVIKKLSPGYRIVFNMYAIEGYSHKEIADELGITEGTSKSQLARARATLQKELKKTELTIEKAIAQ